MLGVTGALGSAAALAAVAGARPVLADTEEGISQQRAMILAVARAGSVFPFRLAAISGDLGSRQEPWQPADAAVAGLPLRGYRPPTTAGLRAAEKTFPGRQLRLARSGAGTLVSAGMLSASQATLLEDIARQSARQSGRDAADLPATAALAIATVFTVPWAAARSAAGQWLDLLARMHRNGTLRAALRAGGIQ